MKQNSAAKRKAIGAQKLDFYLQLLAKWSLEKQQGRVFHCCKQSSFTLRRVK